MRIAEYHRPADLTTVRRLLARPAPVSLLAGGTALVAGLSSQTSDTVVDLRDLPLAFMERRPDGLHLGALTTLAALTPASAAGGWANGLLAHTAQAEGPVNWRNAATIGGLVAQAEATSPLFLALLALEGQAILLGADGPPQQLALRALADAPAAALQRRLLVEVTLPASLAQAHHGMAAAARTPRDQPIVCAVAVVAAKPAVATVVLGGVTATPLVLSGLQEFCRAPARLPGAIADLLANPTADQAVIADFRGSAAYRRHLAGVLARRALSEALA